MGNTVKSMLSRFLTGETRRMKLPVTAMRGKKQKGKGTSLYSDYRVNIIFVLSLKCQSKYHI